MNKLLSLLIGLALPLVASGQNYQFRSFLNVRAIATGTNGLGGGGVTNLSALVTNAGMVFSTNVVFTNAFGAVARSAGSAGGTNSISTAALFNDVALWTDREGRLPITSFGSFDVATNNPVSGMTLYVELTNPLGSNAAVGINICPIWANDKTYEANGIRSTPVSRDDDFSLVIPYNLAGVVSVKTNLPIWKWAGAYGLRVRNITNQLTYISSDAANTNCAWITRMGVSGFVP